MKNPTWKDVLAHKAQFVGGLIVDEHGRRGRIQRMQGLFGKGVLIHFWDAAGSLHRLNLSEEYDARVSKVRAGRIRIDYRGLPFMAYVVMLPKTHPRAQVAA